MLAQLGAILTVVRSVVEKISDIKLRTFAEIVFAVLTLGGCTPTTTPLAGADPADPGARTSGVGYHSTIAPYSSLRPTAPSPWREQNDRAAPAPKSAQ
ncbi:MAG: hypothetical protein EKK40_09425 [Bradyrhizobiaceae bacterium]|nr:MAG: hypothetical protein EKK40_09425 [Bradyrhizobiaceae bacterium]